MVVFDAVSRELAIIFPCVVLILKDSDMLDEVPVSRGSQSGTIPSLLLTISCIAFTLCLETKASTPYVQTDEN